MLGPFCAAYLQGDPRTRGFLRADFRDPASRIEVTRRAAHRPIDPTLLATLHEQNLALPESAARKRNLAALTSPGKDGVAVTVTGQQVGLFLGPLYTVYKAATAIATARALQHETGIPCVPLFWLQTEDHDFAEIHHCHVPIAGAPPLRLELAASDPSQLRTSVAHRLLGPAVSAQLTTLEAALQSQPHAAEFLTWLRRHYRPEATIGEAFAQVLGELFAEEGLLVLDPRRPGSRTVATLAAPLYRRAIVEEEALSAALLARQDALQQAGCAAQIPIRPDTTLTFFHHDSPTGPRYRLERPAWTVPDPSGGKLRFSEAEILATLADNPLRCSSSALLRPLIQDSLLPTAAYIGGPAEVSYFAQLGPLYDHFGIDQPLVMPRARFRCLEDNTRSWLGKLGLEPAEVEAPRAEVLRKLVGRNPSDRPSAEAVRERLLTEFDSRLSELELLDAALRDPVRRARDSIARTITHLTDRYAQALTERDHVTSERVDRLQAFLYPNEEPQERFFSLPFFACKYGVSAFKQKLFASLSDASLFAPAQTVRDLWL
jgi:bacillithiol biosynthesis cysteine-adding enzyme BshC